MSDLQSFEIRIRSGSATRDVDYDAFGFNREYSIAAGWSTTFQVPLTNDGLAEAIETLELEIYDKTAGAVVVGALSSATITILDDDGGAGSVSVVSQLWEYTGIKSPLGNIPGENLREIQHVPYLNGGKPLWYVIEDSTASLFQYHYTALTTSDYQTWTTSDVTVDGMPVGTEWLSSQTVEKRFTGGPKRIVLFQGQLYATVEFGLANGRASLITSRDGVTWQSHANVNVGASRHVFRAYPIAAAQGREGCLPANDTCVTVRDLAVGGTAANQTLYLHSGGPNQPLLKTSDGVLFSRTANLPAGCTFDRLEVLGNIVVVGEQSTGEVCRSADGGATWTRFRPSVDLRGIAPPTDNNAAFLGAGLVDSVTTPTGSYFIGTSGNAQRQFYVRSTDGLNWTAHRYPLPTWPGCTGSNSPVAWAGTRWVYMRPVCDTRDTGRVDVAYISDDGDTWRGVGVLHDYASSSLAPYFFESPIVYADSEGFHNMLDSTFTTFNGSVIARGTTYDAVGVLHRGLVRVRF